MSFLRHREIYRSDMVSKTIITWGPGAASRWSAPVPSLRTRRKGRALLIVRDEFPVGYSLAGCSPAEPASASPTGSSMRWSMSAGNYLSANGNLSLISVSQPRGSLQSRLSPFSFGSRAFDGRAIMPPRSAARQTIRLMAENRRSAPTAAQLSPRAPRVARHPLTAPGRGARSRAYWNHVTNA